MKQYFSTAEVAKLIRQVLKEAFPSIKFAVKSKTYSGGSSITVSYTDGPAACQVESLVKIFQGRYFDGMTDYEGLRYQALDGVEVSFGVSYIFVSRAKSVALVQRVVDRVSAKYGFDFLEVETSSDGTGYLSQIQVSEQAKARGFDWLNVVKIVYTALSKTSCTTSLPSPTAKRVKFLGADGYGWGATGRIQPQQAA